LRSVRRRGAERGGARCTAEHPLAGGSAQALVWTAASALAAAVAAVAAARGVEVGEGPVAAPAQVRDALVARAGMPGAAADALLAHMRRYAPVLQWKLGAPACLVHELAVMVHAPLPSFRDPLLWCCTCTELQARMPADKHTKRCAGCRCVRYCGRRCQSEDWKAGRKRVCAALARLHGVSGGSAGTAGIAASKS
jgi:hypothetical protein